MQTRGGRWPTPRRLAAVYYRRTPWAPAPGFLRTTCDVRERERTDGHQPLLTLRELEAEDPRGRRFSTPFGEEVPVRLEPCALTHPLNMRTRAGDSAGRPLSKATHAEPVWRRAVAQPALVSVSWVWAISTRAQAVRLAHKTLSGLQK